MKRLVPDGDGQRLLVWRHRRADLPGASIHGTSSLRLAKSAISLAMTPDTEEELTLHGRDSVRRKPFLTWLDFARPGTPMSHNSVQQGHKCP
jgi:hypothetical protein